MQNRGDGMVCSLFKFIFMSMRVLPVHRVYAVPVEAREGHLLYLLKLELQVFVNHSEPPCGAEN